MLHSAEEVDVNESLIAGEETLNGTRVHIHACIQTHTGGCMFANTCTHTNTLLMKPLLLIMNYYPDIEFQCSIPQFLPAFTPTLLHLMYLKKIDSFPAGLRNLPCLIWHISLTHILFPSLHLPRSLLLAMHKQSSSHSGSPVFAFPPTLFYPILLPGSLFLPAKRLMSLSVWETYGKQLVTAWRM